MRALVCLAVAVPAFAGCAQLPADIAASSVSDAYYLNMSCSQLMTARGNFQKELRLAASRQAQYVGVVFPSSEYKRNTERIAEIKGELAAIARAHTANACLGPGAAVEDEEALVEDDGGIDIGAEDL